MIENFIIITGLTFACHHISEINACELLPKLYLCNTVNAQIWVGKVFESVVNCFQNRTFAIR